MGGLWWVEGREVEASSFVVGFVSVYAFWCFVGVTPRRVRCEGHARGREGEAPLGSGWEAVEEEGKGRVGGGYGRKQEERRFRRA